MYLFYIMLGVNPIPNHNAQQGVSPQVRVSQTLRPQTSFPTTSSSLGLLTNILSENSIGEKHVYLYYNTHIRKSDGVTNSIINNQRSLQQVKDNFLCTVFQTVFFKLTFAS